MIQDLDETLRELLIRAVPIDPALIDISFAMPGKDWLTAPASKPTINLFLYDIRENAELRSNERYLARSGATGTESRSPARVDLSYLISAWASDVSDEHKLLGEVLRALLSRPLIPPEVLKGAMTGQAYPLRAWIAQAERTPNIWDFWGGLDGRLKAALSYVVTMAVETAAPFEVNLVTEKVLKLQPNAQQGA
jgi:Pvc16 N-terminal domain